MTRPLPARSRVVPPADMQSFRPAYREEMNCQIIPNSIHRREGWTICHLLSLGDIDVGFGVIAVAGPWKDRPTVLEFFVTPEHRSRAFDLFEALLSTSGAGHMEVQTNNRLLTVMLAAYARDILCERILFTDQIKTNLVIPEATLRAQTAEAEIRDAMEARQGGGEWQLFLGDTLVGSGGLLFHYNLPYGDIYMEILEPFRRRGLGAYLVQELKRECYALGAVPGARCNRENMISRKTLQKAGFVPTGTILLGTIEKP